MKGLRELGTLKQHNYLHLNFTFFHRTKMFINVLYQPQVQLAFIQVNIVVIIS